MKFEWVDNGRGYHVARVGDWKLEAMNQFGLSTRVTVSLEGVEVLNVRVATIEAKAVAERWVREHVAPFVAAAVEAEREACAGIADEYFVRRVGVPAAIAERIRARGDGAK